MVDAGFIILAKIVCISKTCLCLKEGSLSVNLLLLPNCYGVVLSKFQFAIHLTTVSKSVLYDVQFSVSY